MFPLVERELGHPSVAGPSSGRRGVGRFGKVMCSELGILGRLVDCWGTAARGMDHSGRVREGAGGGSDGVETSGGGGGAPQLSPRLLKLSALVPRDFH